MSNATCDAGEWRPVFATRCPLSSPPDRTQSVTAVLEPNAALPLALGLVGLSGAMRRSRP